jgi:nucleoside-diphosphate-sugar epimerase
MDQVFFEQLKLPQPKYNLKVGSGTHAEETGKKMMGVVEEANGEAINLASGTETRVIDLANWINEITGNKAGIVFKPRRDWDKAIRRRASIEKARKILGYEPKTDMRTGLRKVYEWFKENWENIKASVKF